jgi:hypothetical protein
LKAFFLKNAAVRHLRDGDEEGWNFLGRKE